MNRTNQLLAIHTTGLFIALVGGAFVVAGWVPPPLPADTKEIVDSFDDATNVRVAAAMFFFGAAFFPVPAVAITEQLRRIEGERHPMANLQMLSAAVGLIAIQIPGALWLVISYRNGIPDTTVITLNDLAWFCLLGAVGPAVVQNLSIAIATLGGDGAVYPRWLGYANLWFAFALMAGVFIPFFKDGPLAWNGILGFWVVAVAFFAWVIMMWVYTVKAIKSE